MRIADMHCDTVSALLSKKKEGKPYSLVKNDLHVDLEKLRAGGSLVQNFAMFIHKGTEASPYEACMELIDLYEELLETAREQIAPVRAVADIKRNEEAGKISAVLTVEEGAAIEGSMEKLYALYKRGVRMLTLTWNFPNEIGYPNALAPDGLPGAWGAGNTENGLTPFGIDCVREMQRIGMIVDVSHLSDAGFYDVLSHTDKPFVASHSNAREVGGHARNLTDDMIKKLAERGGVTGLNFCPFFLSMERDRNAAEGTIAMVVEHAKHIKKVGGCGCIGIGSDFDGIPAHKELPDASYFPKLAEALRGAGFTARETEQICAENVLRVYKDCLL